MESRDERDRILRYLLDEFEPEERQAFEERYFRDDAFFERVCAMEDRLIQQYCSGVGDERTRRRFEDLLRVSPARKERVEMVRALRESGVDRPAAAERPLPFWSKAAACLRLHPAPFLIGALSILIVVVAWVVLQPAPQSPVPGGDPVLLVELSPGRVREASPLQIVRPTQATKTIRFVLRTPDALPSESYSVVVGTPENPSAWTGGSIWDDGFGAHRVDVPSESLQPGDYGLALSLTEGAESRRIATFFFRVSR